MKQTSMDDGGSQPFNPKNIPTYPQPKEPKRRGFLKISFWVWLLLIFVILPILCCCCCLYFCCCRRKADKTSRRQGLSDLPEVGGAPSSGGNGDGLQGFLSKFFTKYFIDGIRDTTIGNIISSKFNRNQKAKEPLPNVVPAMDDVGGSSNDPPPYNINCPPSAPLYPSINVKDEGGGGVW